MLRANFRMTCLVSEARRQIELIEKGDKVAQETRGFDVDSAQTFKLRSKEDAPDYRYMPDPNLPPLLVDEVRITQRIHPYYRHLHSPEPI
jgi:aspartyl-tRNA(Asn)/glutamyl-tRNA(Gln) amidotransferase subunit B